jgi:hypothetical protein
MTVSAQLSTAGALRGSGGPRSWRYLSDAVSTAGVQWGPR